MIRRRSDAFGVECSERVGFSMVMVFSKVFLCFFFFFFFFFSEVFLFFFLRSS